MFKYFKNGVSVSSVLDKRHIHTDGTYAVKVRVGFKSQAWYFPAKMHMKQHDWDKLPSARNPDSVKIREEIYKTFEHVEINVNSLVGQGIFSFQNLKTAIKGIKKQSLNTILQHKIDDLRSEGRIGNMKYYECVLSNLEKFSPINIALEDIDKKWLEQYEKYLLHTKNMTTAIMNLRGIRTALNIAVRKGFIHRDDYPFGGDGYRLKRTLGKKKALTLKQIEAICTFESHDRELMKFRDLFIFMYLCNGITVDDLLDLKYSNIYDGEIFFVRRKTKNMTLEEKEIRAVMTDEIKTIIKRWGNRNRGDNLIFSLIKKTKDPEVRHSRKDTFIKVFNSHLKIIAALLNIPKFTTYSARHSFATIMKRSGVSIAYISESLGHTSLTTTQCYLDSFERETREKNAQFLLKFKDE